MNVAFKEWAIVADALGRGEQIFILRKGGIHEGRAGFAVEHREFLLFPTRFHQQRESVIPSAQQRFDQIEPDFPPLDRLRLEFWAQVVHWQEITSPRLLAELNGQHIWCEEVLRDRFDWGKSQGIVALITRAYRLPQPVEIPMLPKYSGCKSWVLLDEAIDTPGSQPVLTGAEFESKLERFRQTLLQSATK